MKNENFKIYFVLLAILTPLAVICFAVLLCNIDSNRIVAVSSAVISVIGGGFASVVVAFLIELSNQRRENEYSKIILDEIFAGFDNIVSNQMAQILKQYAIDNELDIEREYTYNEIKTFADTFDSYQKLFKTFCSKIYNAIKEIDIKWAMSYARGGQCVMIQQIYDGISAISLLLDGVMKTEDIEDREASFRVYKLGTLFLIDSLNKMYEYRGNPATVILPEKERKMISQVRESKENSTITKRK